MKCIRSFRHSAFAAVIGATLTLLGATPVVAEGEQDVPFVAALSGTAQWDGGPVANCQGTGIASHLGLAMSQCTAVLDFTAYGEYDVCSAAAETGIGIPNVNTMVLTAANGDRLVLESTDIACEVIPFRSFHGVGQWIVLSSESTGRFAGASGTGTFDGNVDFVEGDVQVMLMGEIHY